MVALTTSTRMSDAQIPKFYAGGSILITGATGFMGKVLVERLLMTCPDVARLYLLVRTKKNLTPEQRLQKLKESQVFDAVRQTKSAQLEKLHILPGDITQPALGLSEESIAQLKEVSVVFHSAATIKFDQPALRAVQENLLSVIELLKICDELPNLQAFIHVSTAYSNCELSSIEERVYPPPAPLDELLVAAKECSSDEEFSRRIHEYKAKKTNTYTFTKSMAESAVEQHGYRGYPVSIFRPTIVVSSMKHPFPGWIDNLNGPSGGVVGIGKGIIHVLYGNTVAEVDLIPVDMAIDTLLAVAWETALDNSKETRVYHCSVSENIITWGQFKDKVIENCRKHPYNDVIWYPYGFVTNDRYIFKLLVFMLMTVPHYCAVYFAKMFSINLGVDLISAGYRMVAMLETFEFFTFRGWHFENNNVKKLRERLHPADMKIFSLNPSTIEWDDHIRDFVKGIRKYLLREKDQDIEKAKRHLNRLYTIHIAVNILFVATVGWFLYQVFTSYKLFFGQENTRNYVNL